METVNLASINQKPSLEQATLHLNASLGTAVFRMQPHPRPCFTPTLLDDIRAFQSHMTQTIRVDYQTKGHSDWKYIVFASGDEQTFNLGGDLALFVELIEQRDREKLMDYATACIDGAYGFHTHLGQPVTTIALVEGNAQGGGFEAALSCNVIIAERGTHLGFPEVLFNMFPGMGAYSFLSRRVGTSLAERLIYSGDLYTAETLYDLGVIDILADEGAGEIALSNYIRTAQRRTNALKLLRHVRQNYNSVSYEELLGITTQWVDAALNLRQNEINVMQRLVRAQNKRAAKLAEPPQNSLRQAT
ncbi:MAG: crotonase/enoyl-CoA hydratase family protein [Candidatus Thiodiazotropha endolucinida]